MNDTIKRFAARVVTLAEFVRAQRNAGAMAEIMVSAAVEMCVEDVRKPFARVCACVEICREAEYISCAQYESIMRDIEKVRKEWRI